SRTLALRDMRHAVTRFSSGSGRHLTRRHALGLGVAASAAALAWRRAFAQTQLTIRPGGDFKPMPIAIPDFLPGSAAEGDTPRNITQIIINNLKRSGLFAPIDQAAYIEKITNSDS